MKSLLLTYDYPPLVSGIGTVFSEIWKRLPSGKHLVLAPRLEGWKEYDRERPAYRYVPSANAFFRAVILLFMAVKLVKKEKVGLLVCAVPVSVGGIGLLLKKLLGIPYIVFYYGGEKAKYACTPFLKLIKAVLMNSRTVCVNSEFTREEVLSYGVGREKTLKLTPGVDTRRFSPAPADDLRRRLGLEGKIVLLTVARLVRRKGIDAILKILPRVLADFPLTAYLVVGSGEEESALRSLAANLGIEKAVIFAGSVVDSDLPAYYNACDIFVMANRKTGGRETYEGFGTSFIEASACSKPVIGGVTGGVREAVVDGVTGLLADPEDPDKLSEAVARLIRDPELRRRLGTAGRQRAAADFGWEQRARSLETELEGRP